MSVQLRLAVRAGPRTAYPTGLQLPCVACAAAGVDRLGLPRDDADALCIPCWQGRRRRDEHRARTELRALLWEGLGNAQAAADCALCGSDIPDDDCVCGWSWLAEQRAQFEADQAAAAEAERADVAARFAQLAEITEAEDQVARLTAWVDRCRDALDAARTGGGRARPVELVADLLSRLQYAPGRGRPPAWPRVAAVLALATDWRSGRRGRPGRAPTAALAGCTEMTVTAAWRMFEDLGWCVRTVEGRLATLDERIALGTHRIRAEFDVTPLHRRDPALRAPYRAAALQAFSDVLAAGARQLADAQQLADELHERAGSTTSWDEHVHRARIRAAVARSQADIDELISLPHPVGLSGERSTSGLYLGLPVRCVENLPSVGGGGRPFGRGELGASRSSTTEVRTGRSPRVTHPRTAGGVRAAPRARRAPAWAVWARYLARDLQKLCPWLDGVPRARVAATLGARLGPDWTAAGLLAWLAGVRGRPLLDAPGAPLAYLRTVLDESLTGDVPPPNGARKYTEHRRQLVVAERDERAAAVPQWRRDLDERAAQRARSAADWPEVARPGGGVAQDARTGATERGTR